MNDLYVEATKKTPEVKASDNGIISIIGRSIPEDPLMFYEPLKKWIEEYSKNPQKETIVKIQLEYFNSGTSKILINILRQLVDLKQRCDVKIKWCYEEGDDDIYERGDYFSTILETDFEFIEIPA